MKNSIDWTKTNSQKDFHIIALKLAVSMMNAPELSKRYFDIKPEDHDAIMKMEADQMTGYPTFNDGDMKCPMCRTSLVFVDFFIKTDVMEVESTGSRFACPNESCRMHKFECFWDQEGEYYGSYMKNSETGYFYDVKKDEFISNNTAAFGSWARKANVEIHEHSNDSRYTLIPKINFGFFKTKKIEIMFSNIYESNFNGDIVNDIPKINFIIDGHHYTSGIHMLIYSIKKITWNWWNKNKSQFAKNNFIEEGKKRKGSWQRKEWWRKAAFAYWNVLNFIS